MLSQSTHVSALIRAPWEGVKNSVSADAQEARIRAALAERTRTTNLEFSVQMFLEPAAAPKAWGDRIVVRRALDAAEQASGWLAISATAALALPPWEVEDQLATEVVARAIWLLVADNPTLDWQTIIFKRAQNQHNRKARKQRSDAAARRIREAIAADGAYVAPSGRLVKSWGDGQSTAREKALLRKQALKDRHSKLVVRVMPLVDAGLTLRAVARQLNIAQVPTPAQMRSPEARGEWTAMQVARIVAEARR